MGQPLQIEIGGINILLITENGSVIYLDQAYKGFLSSGNPEAVLRVHYGSLPRPKLKEQVFDTKSTWKMFRNNGEYVLRAFSRLAILKNDFTSGKIYIKSQDAKRIFPLQYPLGELIFINLLAKGRGILMHACGMKNGGKAWLFAGHSGAGKSTLANIWKNEKEVKILNDDRIIIREKQNQFWMHGTPWHGDVKAYTAEKAPIEKIFFLKQAKKNSLKKIAPNEIVSRLVACSFLTFWDKEGMEFTLKFCEEIANKVACYEFGFLPNDSVLKFIRNNA